MKLDLSKFKKKHEDANSVTMEHSDGHQIKIAKQALSSHMQRRLGELKFAEGGEVHEDVRNMPELNLKEENAKNSRVAPETKKRNVDIPKPPPLEPIKGYAEGGDVEEEQQLTTTTPTTTSGLAQDTSTTPTAPAEEAPPTNVSIPQAAPMQQQAAPMNPMAAYQPGMNQEAAGINKQAAAQGQLGEDTAALARDQQQRQLDIQKLHQDSWNKLEQERVNLQSDINNGHIDPQRFMSSKTDTGRVMTAIGLLLGGIGQGMAHLSSNPAMDVLQKQIEQDIDAQKAEMGKKQNLLSANMHQFDNLRDATNMSRVMLADQYIAKLEEAKAKATTPMAKANADIAIGQLKQKYAPLQAAVAQSQAVRQGVAEGKIPLAQAVVAVIPKEHQAKALEEIKQSETAQRAAKGVEQAMHQVAELQSTKNRLMNPVQSKSQIDALNLQIGALGKEMFGRLNEQELKMLANSQVGITDSPQTIAVKINNLRSLINKQSSTPTLNAYGLSAPKMAPATRPNVNAPKGK